jgi:large subunit ribosomal protein L24
MMRVKKDDTVMVLTGKDKNKIGTVIDILPKKSKVMVSGVAIITKHVKARREGESSGIKKYESYIDSSNVMPICRSCKKPCRVKISLLENGDKARACNHCNENL